jgi:amidophosphoribosyltransferase
MGGLFGIVSKMDCVQELYYGTDYQSHLGTMRGGLAVMNDGAITRHIHDITNSQFRTKFEPEIRNMHGNKGIGVISDTDAQPLIFGSHLGRYAIATVGRINNLGDIVKSAYSYRAQFAEQSGDEVSPTGVVAYLIGQKPSFEEGIEYAQNVISGSCSILILTDNGIYAARDRLGRTPLVIGKSANAVSVTSETTSFPNIGSGFEVDKYLGPGEIVLIDHWSLPTKQRKAPETKMQVCSFLWVYYGYPSSSYEGINVEIARERCGAALARRDKKEGLKFDMIAGIPDSGTSHALGYAQEAGIPYRRPFVKYTPTWPRSFMPQNQEMRTLVAKMKLIPIRELIEGKSILFCEDSIVRGTQLQDTIQLLWDYNAKEVHMRPACPPLVYSCDFLNFSRSSSVMQLATRKAMKDLLGKEDFTFQELKDFSNPASREHERMVKHIRETLKLTSLRYQLLDDLVDAVGLSKEDLCTHCWDGSSHS